MTAVLEAPAQLTLADLRAETGFGWSCRTAEVEYGRVVRACEVSGSDRAEYAAHHKSHGHAPLKSAYQRPKPWAAPRPVKVHAPKPMDAGERCEWTSKPRGGHYEHPGGWEGEPCTSRYTAPSGAFIHDAAQTRAGTVWSVATSATEWWVLPDDDPGHPVLVKRHGKKFSSEYREGELYEVAGYAERARLNVLRAELVRRRGIFAVVDCITDSSSWGYRYHSTKQAYVKWHSDQGCPAAEGKERYDRESHGLACGYGHDDYGPWSPIAVAIALTSGSRAPSELCSQCITDVDPEAPEVPAESAPEGDAPEAVPAGADDEMDALRVITVESGGHSAVYTVGDGWGETAAYADMLGPGGTIRVLWGGRELTPELCEQVRDTVRACLAGTGDGQ